MNQKRFFIRPSQVINSMRDNGYKNTAYALAELIDNSIQAGAKCVRLACFEKIRISDEISRRSVQEIDKIAILDDGKGMDANELFLAFEFGSSLNRNDKKGLGKFGMGLPNSSISQCKLAEVWSWKNPSEIFYTYLDIDLIESGDQEHIIFPVKKSIPKDILQAFQGLIPNSGTIVLWSNLDRLKWKTSNSIKGNTENLIGRIYRRYIENGSARITFQTFLYDDKTASYKENQLVYSFKANDPLYLMQKTNLPDLPAEVSQIAPFKVFDSKEISVMLPNGDASIVKITTSIIKDEVVTALRRNTGGKIGATIWGNHMKHNIGLSVMRAGRELELIQNFYVVDGYKDRWVGCEIEFEPALDEYFGVTNNKQHATQIKNVSLFSLASHYIEVDVNKTDAQIEKEIKEYLTENYSPDHQILLIIETVRGMMEQVFSETKRIKFDGLAGKVSSTGAETPATEVQNVINTIATENTDPLERSPTEDAVNEVLDGCNDISDEEKKIIKDEILSKKLKVKLVYTDAGSMGKFFDISSSEGFTLIQINTAHNFYITIMKDCTEMDNLHLFLAIAAWAKMEKTASERTRELMKSVRREWSNSLHDYFNLESLL